MNDDKIEGMSLTDEDMQEVRDMIKALIAEDKGMLLGQELRGIRVQLLVISCFLAVIAAVILGRGLLWR
jgi:hypothetical protein